MIKINKNIYKLNCVHFVLGAIKKVLKLKWCRLEASLCFAKFSLQQKVFLHKISDMALSSISYFLKVLSENLEITESFFCENLSHLLTIGKISNRFWTNAKLLQFNVVTVVTCCLWKYSCIVNGINTSYYDLTISI